MDDICQLYFILNQVKYFLRFFIFEIGFNLNPKKRVQKGLTNLHSKIKESGGCRCEGFGGDVSDGIKEQLDLGSKEVSNCPQKTLALSMKDVSSDSDADFRDSSNSLFSILTHFCQ